MGPGSVIRFFHRGILAFLLLPFAAFAGSQSDGSSKPDLTQLSLPASANDLVRQAITNELNAAEPTERFQFREHKQTPSGSKTEEIIETNEGAVGRQIAINDVPLNAAQDRQEQARLQKLLTDPQTQQKHRKSQQEDLERVRKMLGALPDAFLYRYDGTQNSQYGPLVRLQFEPNPNFKPADRETQVYRGMHGEMLIEPHDRRLAEMNAELFQKVNFGWGIFGRLDPGGHFTVKQTKISPVRWETTEMTLKFTGKVLLFKKLNIDERDTESDFRPAPQKLTLAQGIALLQKHSPEVAQRGGSPAH
jgi:hypothetical protein